MFSTNLPPALKKKQSNNGASFRSLGFIRDGVNEEKLANFTKSLSVLLTAKITLPDALLQVSHQTKAKALVKPLAEILLGLKNGRSFSNCLAAYPHIFNASYCALVQAGEKARILEIVLARLAKHLKRRADLKRKLRMAMVYPLVVLSIALCSLVFLLVSVVPTFEDMFRDFDAELPSLTRFILALSSWVQNYWLMLILLVILLVLLFSFIRKTKRGKLYLERLLLKIPWMGKIWRQSVLTQFSQTMGTLLENGVDLLEAIEIAASAAPSIGFQSEIATVRTELMKGKTLSGALSSSIYFDESAIQLIATGEKTTTLDQMFLFIYEQLDEEVGEAIETLTGLIEPLLIVLLGILVGTVLIAMYLPMFEMVNVMD